MFGIINSIFTKIASVITTVLITVGLVSTSTQPAALSDSQVIAQENKEVKTAEVEDVKTKPLALVEKTIIKEVPVEKVIVKDLSQEKIAEYEKIIRELQARIENLETQNRELKNPAPLPYKEIREINDSNGWLIRLYPNSADILKAIVVLASDGATPIINLKIKATLHDWVSGEGGERTGFGGLTDDRGFTELVDVKLDRDLLGRPRWFYKFFAVFENGQEKEIFRFPTNR